MTSRPSAGVFDAGTYVNDFGTILVQQTLDQSSLQRGEGGPQGRMRGSAASLRFRLSPKALFCAVVLFPPN